MTTQTGTGTEATFDPFSHDGQRMEGVWLVTYSFSPADYSKGNVIFRCSSNMGYKTRLARLADCKVIRGRYTNRSRGYVMSPTKARKLMALIESGRDASAITGELYPIKEEAQQ